MAASAASPSNAKQCVVDLVKYVETGNSRPLTYISAERYTQHNVLMADGIEGLIELRDRAMKRSTSVKTVRVFQDGRFVIAHSEYELFGPKIGFDIFRFENGRIVEHWDNFQKRPSDANPSGHTMIDGATEIVDLGRTVRNKALAQAFVHNVLVSGRHHQMSRLIDAHCYIQHNPQIADGICGMQEALRRMREQKVTLRYDRIHYVLGEGNFVLVVSDGYFLSRRRCFYDLFRFEAGRIAEHWDTIEAIPPRAQWKHVNGKF